MICGSLAEYGAEALTKEQASLALPCKICEADSLRYDLIDFEKHVSAFPHSRPLRGVPVVYRRCSRCSFIFTNFFDDFTPEDWTQYIYNEDYRAVDPEYAEIRPRHNAKAIQAYLGDLKETSEGLDFGGGNGLTAALLRQKGWHFSSFDPYGLNETEPGRQYNLVTSFEVFEHTTDPRATLRMLLDKASKGPLIVLISTALTDCFINEATRLSWSYAAPRNGHVSLYSRASFMALAAQFGLHYSNSSYSTHILSRGFQRAALSRRLRLGRIKLTISKKIGF